MLVSYKLLPAWVVAAVLLAGLAADADASLKLRLTDSATTDFKLIVDDGTDDNFGTTPGIISFTGSVGTFTLTVTTAKSKPVVGSASFPELSMTVDASTTSSTMSTLTIELTDTGFGSSLTSLVFVTTFGSSSPSTQSITISSFLDLSNAEFGTGAGTTPLSSLGPSSGEFGDSGFASATTDTAYSLTLVAELEHGGAGSSSFNAAVFAIPEPVSLFTWAGLTCMALARGHRRR